MKFCMCNIFMFLELLLFKKECLVFKIFLYNVYVIKRCYFILCNYNFKKNVLFYEYYKNCK